MQWFLIVKLLALLSAANGAPILARWLLKDRVAPKDAVLAHARTDPEIANVCRMAIVAHC
jgi:hypothetical protein